VLTVADLLADPWFSRIDLVSSKNPDQLAALAERHVLLALWGWLRWSLAPLLAVGRCGSARNAR